MCEHWFPSNKSNKKRHANEPCFHRSIADEFDWLPVLICFVRIYFNVDLWPEMPKDFLKISFYCCNPESNRKQTQFVSKNVYTYAMHHPHLNGKLWNDFISISFENLTICYSRLWIQWKWMKLSDVNFGQTLSMCLGNWKSLSSRDKTNEFLYKSDANVLSLKLMLFLSFQCYTFWKQFTSCRSQVTLKTKKIEC